MAPTIVVLGGAYSGLYVVHYLLKHNKEAKVILVSKNSHFFWNLAAVRAIVPGGIDESRLFIALADALDRYPKDRVELIVGSAEAVDTTAKTVRVAATGSERTLTYDHLVLATGSRNTLPAKATPEDTTPLMPWKADATYEDIKTLLASAQERVEAAKHIVIVGGGATGVEVAAELGHAFGKAPSKTTGKDENKDGKNGKDTGKTIVLLSSSTELVGGDKVVAAAARSGLESLHVDVRTGCSVTAARTLPDGRVSLTLVSAEAGAGAAPEPLVTDLYLAAVGLTPNTDYLDAALLDARKCVDVDECYRARGVASNDVWAVGDVVSKPRAGFMLAQKQAAGVAKNIDAVLRGQSPTPVKLLPVDILAIALGPSRGVGRMNSWRLPSCGVWLAKARTLGTQMLPSYLNGSVA